MVRHNDTGFPLLIGVCGHRSFDPSCATELAAQVRTQLLRLATAHPSTEIRVLSGMGAVKVTDRESLRSRLRDAGL